MKVPHKPKIAVLKGGISDEYTLSLQNGQQVSDVLKAAGNCEVVDITVTKKGEWLEHGIARDPQHVLQHVDSVYIGLHGLYGEDGTVQRTIERAGVPYNGSKPYQSAVGLNKSLTKEHLQGSGIKQAPHMRLNKDAISDMHATTSTVEKLFGPEYVIKPLFGGSSIGNRYATGAVELAKVLQEMFQEYDNVIVEEKITGASVTCGVMDNFRDIPLYHTPVVEIALTKDTAEDIFVAEKIAPGRFTKDARDEVAAAAQKIHRELGLKDYSRSDFIITPNGELYFLEVNTLPAVTDNSPLMAGFEAVGASQEEVVCHLCGNDIV